ncbi:MAG: OsmC family peroxiredoxin [Phycisphaeraceae bacterium]|nr:OsmC family peroxiredoxin [Phycisphaeraceae bacterium]
MEPRKAQAQWQGSLAQGQGMLQTSSGLFSGPYSSESRFGVGEGTNPEELLGAAHAGCYSMALTHALEEAGFTPESVWTVAEVTLDSAKEGFAITKIHLQTQAKVAEIGSSQFQTMAETVKETCPVSQALNSVPITLQATAIPPTVPTSS